jgi:hypothetical protein
MIMAPGDSFQFTRVEFITQSDIKDAGDPV